MGYRPGHVTRFGLRENALAEHPDIADNEASVRQFLKDKVSRFEQPRDITIVEEIPRNPAGKVVRDELRP